VHVQIIQNACGSGRVSVADYIRVLKFFAQKDLDLIKAHKAAGNEAVAKFITERVLLVRKDLTDLAAVPT
jgi:hypothetical protein